MNRNVQRTTAASENFAFRFEELNKPRQNFVLTGNLINIVKQSFGYRADFEDFTSKPYAQKPHTLPARQGATSKLGAGIHFKILNLFYENNCSTI